MTANRTLIISSGSPPRIYKAIKAKEPLDRMFSDDPTRFCYYTEALAGSGNNETLDGIPSECGFENPHDVAVDEDSHCCYVTSGYAVQKIHFKNE
jgi:hypothetical protein